MGKFKNSDIHDRYSNWHWKLAEKNEEYKSLFMSDIDRIFVEVDIDGNAVLAAFDLKYDNGYDNVSSTEEVLYKWLDKVGVRCYIVYISQDFSNFKVLRFADNKIVNMTEQEYANWLVKLRKYLKQVGNMPT